MNVAVSNTTRTRLVRGSNCGFSGIHVMNRSASGVTVIVSDTATAGTTKPWVCWYIARANGGLPNNFYKPQEPARMNNGCWVQLLGATSGVTATVYH